MKRNRRNKIIAFAFAMIMVIGLVKVNTIDANAAGNVTIDKTTFPDDIFREYVKSNCDTDGDGKLSQTEISNVTHIDVYNMQISDLSGIKIFTNLEYLNCWGNQLTSLDVSNCSKLYSLDCDINQLTSLDVSNCSELYSLACNNNKLTSINVSGCGKLQELKCYNNELTSLDVSGCSALWNLDCNNNKLTSLNLSGCSALWGLYCNNNKLTSLDVSDCSILARLDCRENKLISLDVSNCELSYFHCEGNQLTELDLSGCSYLKELDCSENQLTSLDVSSCSKLENFKASLNKTAIQLSSARQFDLSTLPGFDVSKVKSITGGTIKGNILSANKGVSEVTYVYDMGKGYTETFMLMLIEPPVPVTVSYHTHVQTYGWEKDWRQNGAMSGTQGESKRLEGIEIKVSGNKNVGIRYKTHVQTYGWEQEWKKNGTMSGTQGEAKRLEAICIELTGADKDKYDVYYRVHAQSYGWLGWAKNGQPAGTAGQAKRLEGIEIKVLPKGEKPEGIVGYSYIELGKVAKNNQSAGMVNYMTHVQSYGDQSYVFDGSVSGTFGEAKRLEGIRINLNNDLTGVSGGITYRTHVQSYGWLGWSSNGAFNGTQGESKRLEAIEIKLTGEMANQYDVYYRVHAQTYGWLGWAKNGESAGTAKLAKRLEGIQIVVLPKGSPAPGILPGVAGTPAFITQ